MASNLPHEKICYRAARAIIRAARRTSIGAAAFGMAFFGLFSSGPLSAETYLYVDAAGNDHAAGTSRASALRSPQRALEISRKYPKPTTIILSGRHRLKTPIILEQGDSGLRLTSDVSDPGVLLSHGLNTAVVVKAPGSEVSGLTIIGAKHRGIFVKDATHVVIRSNRVVETRSDGWSQAAIHLTGTVAGSIVDSNYVIGADYAGILVDTNTKSDVSRIRITENRVEKTCRTVADCGAIYINDRARQSSGTLIADNFISDFGPGSTKGRGIYLDDWASNVTVRNNHIEGRGTYAFQIHGGRGNLITGNRVDLTKGVIPLLYQKHVSGRSHDRMRGNRIVANEFRGAPGAAEIVSRRSAGDAAPVLQGNVICTPRRCSDFGS